MSVTNWVIIAIVIAGIAAALFGVDRYRGSRKDARRQRRAADR